MTTEIARIRREAYYVAQKLWNALESLRQQSVALVIELSKTREDRYFLGFLLARGFVESGIRGLSCKRLQAMMSANELSVLIIPALGGEPREVMVERSTQYLARRPDFCAYVRNKPAARRGQRGSDSCVPEPNPGVPEVQHVQWAQTGRAVSRRTRRSSGRTGWDNAFPV